MPKFRNPESITPFFRSLIEEAECKSPKEYARKMEMSVDMAYKYAAGLEAFGPEVRTLVESARKQAAKSGISPVEFISGILGLTA